MTIAMHKRPMSPPVPVARQMFVAASSLAIAGLLGACATTERSAGAPAAGAVPARSDAPVAQGGAGGMAIIGALKSAESALTTYARARSRESGLRDAVQAAADAALVARHRQTVGVADFLTVSDAEQRLAVAEQDLKTGEAATRAARARLYRALGLGDGDKRQGNGAMSVPVSAPPSTATSMPSVLPLLQSDAPARLSAGRLL